MRETPRLLSLFQTALFIFTLSVSLPLFASAIRLPGESFEEARDRNLPRPAWSVSNPTAYESAVDWATLDTRSLPTQLHVTKLFEFIRDSRFLHSYKDPTSFPRRGSWMYPYDGCWTRASAARRWARDNGYGDMAKIFIFGSLRVDTPNSLHGSVSWWYHVVPVFQDDKGVPMVADPAIDSKRALTLKEWVLTMVSSVTDATYSICSPSTYQPGDACVQTDDDADASATDDQKGFLESEWTNLEMLGRDPSRELGDYPPWLVP